MRSESKAFRDQADDCRDLAGHTNDKLAQRELRGLAKDLDEAARDIDIEDAAQCNDDLTPNA